MTPERRLQTRALLVMTELGRADAMASLERRTGVDHALPAAFAAFCARWAVGAALDPAPLYGAYGDAFEATSKTNAGGAFERLGRTLVCTACAPRIDPSAQRIDVIRSHDGVLGHVLSVRHVGEAERRGVVR